MQRYEMDAWLGDAAQYLTDEQTEAFAKVWEKASSLPGAEDDDMYVQDVLSGALQHLLGELDLAAEGRAYRQARATAEAHAVGAVLAGMHEAQAARESTLQRATVRKMLGK